MVTDRETERIRRFVCEQLRDEPDLSTLTLGILKKRYLAQVRCDSLSPEAKGFMKRMVEEELIKMQDYDENESDLETKKPQNKRKRGKEKDQSISGEEDEDESRAKKSRFQSSSSSESEEKKGSKTGSEESEAEEQVKSESEDERQKVKTNGKGKPQLNSKDSSDEEMNGEMRNGKTRSEKKTLQSDEESESDSDSKRERSEKINDSSDDSEKEDKASVKKENNDPDSNSSSLPSLEDEQSNNSGTEKVEENKKKKTTKKEEHTISQKDDNKAVTRLKRYIALCGVRKNYKKLLEGCHSVNSQVEVLKKELEDLGVSGSPSIKKCKKARMKREEAQELAGLDVSNIISSQGRPKRRGASGWQQQLDSPSSTYQRTLNTSSESDEESNTRRGHRRATDWANLQGIISDDADSD